MHRLVHRRTSLLTAVAVLVLAIPTLASAATACVQPQGHFGCQKTIGGAVAAAAPGDVIYVWPGIYKEMVTITQSVSLVAIPGSHAVIDATGLSNGIFVNGMPAAPMAGVANVVVSGFEVRHANFEGILVVNGSNITLTGNNVHHNNLSLDTTALACPAIPAFETNEGEDCGEGIHLMGTDHSTVRDNDIDFNSGGILISDETGPAQNNVIAGNSVHDNPYDCGITLASHGPAPGVVSHGPFGIWNNTISHNASFRNGDKQPGAGAGVGIFAPFPGTTNTGNVVVGNEIYNNGLPGVTMHNHASSPTGVPPVNMNDNKIIGNHIYGNAADTQDAATSGPTGINLYSTAPVTGTVISGNDIDNEAIAIAYNVPSGQLNVHFNNLPHSVGVDNIGTGTVDATENWWNCLTGPGSGHCASVTGPNISTAPWLFTPAVTY